MSKKIFDRVREKAAKTVAARHAAGEEKQKSTIVVDSTPIPEVGSSSVAVNPVSGEKKMLTLNRVNPDRKGSSIVYSFGEGHRGTVKFARSLFGVVIPNQLPGDVSQWPIASGTTPKAKMTKEERAAARAAMTPAQKIERAKAIAAKAAERAAKLEASLSA
jgi:hypothetical protein